MNRQPDRNRLRALDDVEPPDQWDDIVVRAGTDLQRLQLSPARSSHRLLVAAVLIVLAGVASALVVSTTSREGGYETVAADISSPPSLPSGGERAPGTDDTTPGGLPVPTTAPDEPVAPDAGETGSAPGGSSGPSNQGGGSAPGGVVPQTTVTVAPPATVPTTTVVAPPTTTVTTTSTTTVATQPPVTTSTIQPPVTTSTTPADADAGGGVPPDSPPSPIWGTRWQVVAMAQAGASRTLAAERPLSVDTRTKGQLVLSVCNRIPSVASVDGKRLVVSVGRSTGLTCGESLDGHETFLGAFLNDDPSFAVDGNRLVLTVGNRRVELVPY